MVANLFQPKYLTRHTSGRNVLSTRRVVYHDRLDYPTFLFLFGYIKMCYHLAT